MLRRKTACNFEERQMSVHQSALRFATPARRARVAFAAGSGTDGN
jgi:hypothetical protein